MRIHCPHCEGEFQLSSQRFKQHKGVLSCPHCQKAFNARAHIVPIEQEQTAEAVSNQQQQQEKEQELEALLAQQSSGVAWGSLLLNGLLVLLLSISLAGQYLWFTRPDYLLQHAQIRPVLVQACNLIGCELPATRDIQAMMVQERHMGKHPDASGAVLVQFNFLNRAHFPQPYPNISLRFEDENKHLIAGRVFTPSEYLGDSLQAQQAMPSQSPVYVKLELHNIVPNMHTYGFHIDFL